jgi:gas vesicle protein
MRDNPDFRLPEKVEERLQRIGVSVRPYQRSGIYWLNWLGRNRLHGILFAPKSGEETREDLAETFKEIKAVIGYKLQEAKEFSREKYDQIVGSVVTGYQEAKRITPQEAEKIKDILTESFDKIQAAINEGSEDIHNDIKEAMKDTKNELQ